MAANSSIILSNLDFDTIKNTFKAYLKSQDRFNDYDFEGSNMNVLLDLLSYNTFHNAFYLNMIGNEMFLDSAQLRDSVVSHAKELNYTPRSFKSAEANVTITITTSDTSKRSLVVPKGTPFKSNFGAKNYTFTTNENIIIDTFEFTNGGTTLTFSKPNIALYEGFYVNDTYTYNYSGAQRFLITNKNVDTSSIGVTVIEDLGANTIVYTRALSLFNLDSDSNVFFLQGAENDSFEIMFGDGVSGRRPKDNSIIVIEYRISNGELPNGCNDFKASTTIDGETNITVTTATKASGGSVSESLESIKFNAPRHFATQERAVTTGDYETLLKINFPEVNTVTAYGGEDLDPPQFGKVFIAVDLKDIDTLPDSKKDQYYNFLKSRSPVSIDPTFVSPEYTYINVISHINYNVNTTRLTVDDIKTIASSAIIDYAQTYLNNFNRVFRYSNLVRAIDVSQSSIVSNETSVRLVKYLTPTLNSNDPFDIDFATELDTSRLESTGGTTIVSTEFVYGGVRCIMNDNNGRIVLIAVNDGQTVADVGSIDYTRGIVQLSNFNIQSFSGNVIKVYAVPKNKDISTINNVILNIVDEDLNITVTPVRA